MTHATIRHIDTGTMAVEFAYNKDLKDAIASITGATWQKKNKQWFVPVAALGQVVKLFWPNVSLDYEVLRDRDEQLRRMFRQYQAAGIRFWLDNGMVACDNAALHDHFAKNGTILHAQALEYVLSKPATERTPRRSVSPNDKQDAERLQKWLTGVQNAIANEEKQQAIIANRHRKQAA